MKLNIKQSFADGVTIGFGYIPVALAFGMSAKLLLTGMDTFLMSTLVYGGASQFLILQMMPLSSALAIILAVFILNSRHFVMSLKINYDIKQESLLKRFLVSSYVTDEAFAISASYGIERKNFASYFTTFITAYLFWPTFGIIGYFTGSIMTDNMILASGIALYAMFIALLVPAVQLHIKYGIVAILGMLLHYLFTLMPWFPSGIAIIAAMLLAALAGLIIEEKSERK